MADEMDDEMDDEFYSPKHELSPIPPTLSRTPVNIESVSPTPPNMVDKKVGNVPNMVDKEVDNAFMVEQRRRKKQEAIEKAIKEADKKFKQGKGKTFEHFNKDKKEIEQDKQETIKKFEQKQQTFKKEHDEAIKNVDREKQETIEEMRNKLEKEKQVAIKKLEN